MKSFASECMLQCCRAASYLQSARRLSNVFFQMAKDS